MTAHKGNTITMTNKQQIASLDPRVAIALSRMALEYIKFIK